MSTGKIVEIIGAVIDVEFPRDSVPKVYDALTVQETELTLEVQQQLGDGVVRCIAMGSSDGLRRGLEATNTARQFRYLWVKKPSAVSWTCLVTQSIRKVLSVSKSVCLFTVKHLSWKN